MYEVTNLNINHLTPASSDKNCLLQILIKTVTKVHRMMIKLDLWKYIFLVFTERRIENFG